MDISQLSVLECISFEEHCQSLKVSLYFRCCKSHPCPCHIASGLLQCGPCLPSTFFSLKATESPKFLTGVRQYEQVIPICLPVSKRIKYKVPMLLLIISRILSPWSKAYYLFYSFILFQYYFTTVAHFSQRLFFRAPVKHVVQQRKMYTYTHQINLNR